MKYKVCFITYPDISLFPDNFHPVDCRGVQEVAGVVPDNIFGTEEYKDSDYLIVKSSVGEKRYYDLDGEVVKMFDIKYGTSRDVLMEAVRYQNEELPKLQAAEHVKVLPPE